MNKKLKKKRDLTIWWIDHESKISIVLLIGKLMIVALLILICSKYLFYE